jgi:hypothetical protein
MVRALVSHTRGRRFESYTAHHLIARGTNVRTQQMEFDKA